MDDTPIIIDCDTGRDDALTIWTALSDKLDLELCAVVTSYGNVNLDQVTENTVRVLGLAGRNDLPVLKGATEPLDNAHKGYKEVTLPRQETSGNGLCNVILPETSRPEQKDNSPAEQAELIAKLADKNGALDYYIIGPATNFATICRELGDDINNVINRVVMMGGKLEPLWTEMPGPDFNLICDPEALGEILATKIPFTFVPMNTTWPLKMHLDDVRLLSTDTSVSGAAKNLMIAYCLDFAPDKIFRFHDPSVLFESLYKDACETQKLGIITDQDNPEYGRLDEDAENARDVKVFLPDEEKRAEILDEILDALGLKHA